MMWKIEDKYKVCCHNASCDSFDSCVDCWDEFSDRCPPMTNADRIRAMSDEELADFLSRLAYACDEPWSNLFALKFCYNCPEPEYTLDDGRKMNLHECDFKDGKCPHGSDVMWWLNQAAEEATK